MTPRRPCDGVWCGDDMPCQWGLMSWTEVFEALEPPRLRSETPPRDLWKFGRTEMETSPLFEKMTCFSWKISFIVEETVFCMIYHVQMNICVGFGIPCFLGLVFFHGVQQVSKGVSSKERFQVSVYFHYMYFYDFVHSRPLSPHTLLHLIPHVFFVLRLKIRSRQIFHQEASPSSSHRRWLILQVFRKTRLISAWCCGNLVRGILPQKVTRLGKHDESWIRPDEVLLSWSDQTIPIQRYKDDENWWTLTQERDTRLVSVELSVDQPQLVWIHSKFHWTLIQQVYVQIDIDHTRCTKYNY